VPTAILVDGGFFIKRYPRCYGHGSSAQEVAKKLFTMALRHLESKHRPRRELYRIFFYDCPPSTKKTHHPITNKPVDFSKLPGARFHAELHGELLKLRKVALRLGYLADRTATWVIKPDKTKKLLNGRISIDELEERDVFYDLRQKGVDMRIGLDISSLAYKQQVDQIVLVSGDSDFVPAAKLARREGVDFVLDPMWQNIRQDLFEHIDGLRSTCPRPAPRQSLGSTEAA
jgi:uncharacterized LabA/DUF88 family protein